MKYRYKREMKIREKRGGERDRDGERKRKREKRREK